MTLTSSPSSTAVSGALEEFEAAGDRRCRGHDRVVRVAQGPLEGAGVACALTLSSSFGGLAREQRGEVDDDRSARGRGGEARCLPLRSGSTSPTALAAPLEAGIRLMAAARARRRSLCGLSLQATGRGVGVDRRHQVFLEPEHLRRTFGDGARQFVVHDAFEMMWCSYGVVGVVEVGTPSATVTSGSVAAPRMIIFCAPA